MDAYDAGTLQFPAFFANAQALNICEVESILRGPYSRSQTAQEGSHLSRAYKHALKFSRIRDVQALQQLRIALEDWEPPSSLGAIVTSEDSKLNPFEVAQLVNLMPVDVDETKALIPSLGRFTNSDVLSALEILGQYSKLGGSDIMVL
jgi:DNA-directed RNA polymerase subunit F